jgi:hypothetical protein
VSLVLTIVIVITVGVLALIVIIALVILLAAVPFSRVGAIAVATILVLVTS